MTSEMQNKLWLLDWELCGRAERMAVLQMQFYLGFFQIISEISLVVRLCDILILD